jgi:hypothetical protein
VLDVGRDCRHYALREPELTGPSRARRRAAHASDARMGLFRWSTDGDQWKYGVMEPYSTMEAFKSKSAVKAAVTILLSNTQAASMDEVTAAIRRNTGRYISRSALIRGITAAALTRRQDWIQCRDEQDICVLVLAHLTDRMDLQAASLKLNQLKAAGAV